MEETEFKPSDFSNSVKERLSAMSQEYEKLRHAKFDSPESKPKQPCTNLLVQENSALPQNG